MDMKRYYYDRKRNLFVDEFQRLWHLTYVLDTIKWEHVGYIEYLPDGFEYIEFYGR